MSLGKKRMLDGFVSTHCLILATLWKSSQQARWKETNLPNIHMDVCFLCLMVLCKRTSVRKIRMLGRLVSTHPKSTLTLAILCKSSQRCETENTFQMQTFFFSFAISPIPLLIAEFDPSIL
jgi:hypothetical protein